MLPLQIDVTESEACEGCTISRHSCYWLYGWRARLVLAVLRRVGGRL